MVMVLLQNELLAVSQDNGDRKVLGYEEGHVGKGEEQVQVLSPSCTRILIQAFPARVSRTKCAVNPALHT